MAGLGRTGPGRIIRQTLGVLSLADSSTEPTDSRPPRLGGSRTVRACFSTLERALRQPRILRPDVRQCVRHDPAGDRTYDSTANSDQDRDPRRPPTHPKVANGGRDVLLLQLGELVAGASRPRRSVDLLLSPLANRPYVSIV